MSKRYERLLQEASIAASVKDWRKCADHYLEAYTTCASSWPGRFNCLSGFSSVLREGALQTTHSDFKAIKAIADGDRTATDRSTTLEKTVAHFAVGLMRFIQGKREAAARSYRKCIDTGIGASTQERAERVVMPNMERGKFWPTHCGPIFDATVTDARGNLAVLEGTGSAECSVAGKRTVSLGPMTDAHRKSVDLRLQVGGSVCDACGAAPGPGKSPTLKRCSRCKEAYYCNAECAKAAWRRGHKKACRAAGQFEVGDWVLVKKTPAQAASSSLPSSFVLERGDVMELLAQEQIQGQEHWQLVALGAAMDAPTVTFLTTDLKHIRPAA